MSNGKDKNITRDHMIVLFSNPRSSSWIIPNDNANAYYISSIRNTDAVTVFQYADLDLVPRQLGQEEPFRNCIAVIPRAEEEISQLAQLIWRPELGHSELWFLCQTPGDNPPKLQGCTEIPVRNVPVFPYESAIGVEMQCARLRSLHEVEYLMRTWPYVIYESVWLAFDDPPKGAFSEFRLCEGADYFLFKRMARGANLPTVLLDVVGLEGAWKYSIKQDAWHHESGDPLFCIPADRRFLFEKAFEQLAHRLGYTMYHSLFTEAIFVNFVQRGELAVNHA